MLVFFYKARGLGKGKKKMNAAEYLNGLVNGINAATRLANEALAAGDDKGYQQALAAQAQLPAAYNAAA